MRKKNKNKNKKIAPKPGFEPGSQNQKSRILPSELRRLLSQVGREDVYILLSPSRSLKPTRFKLTLLARGQRRTGRGGWGVKFFC